MQGVCYWLLTNLRPSLKTFLRHAEPTSLQFSDFSSAQNGEKVLPAVTLFGLHSMTQTDTPCFSMSRQVQSCHISKTHQKPIKALMVLMVLMLWCSVSTGRISSAMAMASITFQQAIRTPSTSGADVENEQHTSRRALVAVGRT